VVKCRSRNGFVLIVTCIVLTLLLGFAALGIDIGRMYVIKSELQAFTDAASLGAALELDGTDSGIARARIAPAHLASGPTAMKWDMGTRPITEIVTTFAKPETTPDTRAWQAAPDSPGDYRLVRVVATAPAPLIFLRVFRPLGADFSTVASSSVAIKTPEQARLFE
jgi:Flp pilus assembly protein TadG